MPASRVRTNRQHRGQVRDSAWSRTLLLVSGLLAGLLLCELIVRVFVPKPPRPRITQPAGFSPFMRTPEGLEVYRPGVAFSHIYDVNGDRRGYFGPQGRIQYRINNLGFRGPDIVADKPSGVRRILCLGDSFTFGEGVREEDAWPHRLAVLLGPGNEVINAGVQGYDLDREGLLLFLEGRRLKPDVVIVAFFMNDAMPFEQTVAQHQVTTETSPALSPLGRISAAWGFVERRQFARHQTRAYVEEIRESFASEHWRQAKARIPRWRQMGEHDGFAVLAVVFPLLYELGKDYPLEREHAEVREAFQASGTDVIDLLDSYRGRNAYDLWAHPVDPHPNDVAHGMAAERIAAYLKMKFPSSGNTRLGPEQSGSDPHHNEK